MWSAYRQPANNIAEDEAVPPELFTPKRYRQQESFDTGFLTSLATYFGNRPVVGFMIEYAVLSYIRLNGLAIDAEIRKPMELRRKE